MRSYQCRRTRALAGAVVRPQPTAPATALSIGRAPGLGGGGHLSNHGVGGRRREPRLALGIWDPLRCDEQVLAQEGWVIELGSDEDRAMLYLTNPPRMVHN